MLGEGGDMPVWMSIPTLYIQILRAAEVTNMRSARFMSVEDVLFLLRKDRVCNYYAIYTGLASYPAFPHPDFHTGSDKSLAGYEAII